MDRNLLIVESPAKAKTLKKYLGSSFDILASYGHVRDLIPKKGAVDPEQQFEMKYRIIEKNAKNIDAICDKAKDVSAIYIATDPDREGEVIAFHIQKILEEKKILKKQQISRVVFHEVTKSAVQAAIAHPRVLDMHLVYAQKARRALDYLVGFNLSPLLWKKVRRGLSAGRVQSPALRMIVEREQEIKKFITQEYWTIEADLIEAKHPFTAKLIEYQSEKVEQFSVTTKEQAKTIEEKLNGLAKGKLRVEKIVKSQRKRNPAAPFTTSTLQQEASRKLGFGTQRTMRIAQQLYEGIDVGEGAVGLITYMRTDSVNLAGEAISQIRDFIQERYGKETLPSEARVFKTKAKNVQEAHEAIRPTNITLLPDNIKSYLSPDQYKLYNLIWKRTVACQMIPAVLDLVAVDLSCGSGNIFRANGSTVTIPGFMTVYLEGKDEEDNEEEKGLLPVMKEGQMVELQTIKGEQHFTEPPPRYTEASLVKALEEHGIGRPSTYATIISTLLQREYVTLEQKRFHSTDVGDIVAKFLTDYFPKYVDYEFTAKLEDELDAISRGERQWVPVMDEFWHPFIQQVHVTEENVQRKDVTHEALDEKCPKCSKPLSIRLGRRGRFVGCTGYPECDYTRSLDGESITPADTPTIEGRNCPNCQSDLVLKQGRYGKFIGCSQYPKCKYIESLNKPEETETVCPVCQKHHLIKKKSRYGTFFYSCKGYPDCKYAIKYPPINEPCPKCQWPILMKRETKRRGVEKACPQKECDYVEPYSEEEALTEASKKAQGG